MLKQHGIDEKTIARVTRAVTKTLPQVGVSTKELQKKIYGISSQDFNEYLEKNTEKSDPVQKFCQLIGQYDYERATSQGTELPQLNPLFILQASLSSLSVERFSQKNEVFQKSENLKIESLEKENPVDLNPESNKFIRLFDK